jgi:glycosyltransferase domain-containing protein
MHAPEFNNLFMATETLENWLFSKLQQSNVTQRSLDELSLLTVVIPSYGRQDFLLRQCVYWQGSGAVVLIVDGSPKPLEERVQSMISGLGDIKYLHSATSVMDRLKQASKLIDTRYTVMLGDDEFLLFSGLRSAINLLEKNHELVACIGQSLHYYLSDDGSKCSYGKGYDTFRYEIKQDHVQDRLNSSMKDYNAATCYAVTRSSIWGRSWGNLQEFSSAYVFELEHALVTYIWGKLGSVDDVYWMRSSENPPTSTADTNRSLSTEDWWTYAKYKTEQVNFVTKLGDELMSAQQIDRVTAEAMISYAVGVYLQDTNHTGSSFFHKKCRQFALSVLKKWLPEIWVGRMKQLRCRLKPAKPKALVIGNFGNLADLKAKKTPLPFLFNEELVADLSAMEKLIADFYMARSVQSK